MSFLLSFSCARKKGYTGKVVYQRTTYQQCLEHYVGKKPILLVKKIGAPDIIMKNSSYIVFEWKTIERADRDFWWIGKIQCITRIFINPNNGLIEDVFSYGTRCVPF